jgi:hypothetical protein
MLDQIDVKLVRAKEQPRAKRKREAMLRQSRQHLHAAAADRTPNPMAFFFSSMNFR